ASELPSDSWNLLREKHLVSPAFSASVTLKLVEEVQCVVDRRQQQELTIEIREVTTVPNGPNARAHITVAGKVGGVLSVSQALPALPRKGAPPRMRMLALRTYTHPADNWVVARSSSLLRVSNIDPGNGRPAPLRQPRSVFLITAWPAKEVCLSLPQSSARG